MMTLGSFFKNSASSPAVIRTSVMAASPVFVVAVRVEQKPLLRSALGKHLAKWLGGGRDDGNEIGFAKPALGTVTPEVTARAAMEHRRMRGRDAGISQPQPKRDDAAPIAVIRVVGIARQRHGFLLELGVQL